MARTDTKHNIFKTVLGTSAYNIALVGKRICLSCILGANRFGIIKTEFSVASTGRCKCH